MGKPTCPSDKNHPPLAGKIWFTEKNRRGENQTLASHLIMKIIAPLKARDWFKWKMRINWAITIAAFIILFLILVPFVEWWLAIGVSGLGAFCLFLLYLDRRTIGIQCQSAKCLKIIETNTPWECGFKHCQNENTNAFPFINQCEHCHFIPKAYECHHCG